MKNNVSIRCIFTLIILISADLFAQPQQGIQWQHCLGGSSRDGANSIEQSADGGYIVAGFTYSRDGDVVGNHGGTPLNPDAVDFWVVKLDNAGALQLQKCLGGTDADVARSVRQTSDGGYIVAGSTNSNNGDVSGNHGAGDIWIVKLSASGTIQWQRSLGGTSYEDAYCVRQTTDGGYIISGYSESNDGDVSGNHASPFVIYDGDYWLVKLDNQGAIQWQKCLGGSGDDANARVEPTPDGGYVVSGTSSSNDGDVTGNHGNSDAWVVKLDGSGNLQWQRCLGGTGYEEGIPYPTSDGGYLVVGKSISNDGDVSGNHGYYDAWAVKLDAVGSILWQRSLGGSNYDEFSSVQQTMDGGYILSGTTLSTDGDVFGTKDPFPADTNYATDAWVVKLTASGALQWNKCFGGSYYDQGKAVRQTYDGGFVLAGQTSSNDGDVIGRHGPFTAEDMWVVKISATIGVDERPSITSLSIYPTPASTNLFISFDRSSSLDVDILITDILGNNIGNPIHAESATGHQTITVSTDQFSDGIYFLEVKSEQGSIIRKFVVERR